MMLMTSDNDQVLEVQEISFKKLPEISILYVYRSVG